MDTQEKEVSPTLLTSEQAAKHLNINSPSIVRLIDVLPPQDNSRKINGFIYQSVLWVQLERIAHMYKIEMRIYEVLGVKVFRKCVFVLEKLIHCKDKGRNKNYHISCQNPTGIDSFIKYLFYNGAIHIRNIILFIITFFCKWLVFRSWWWTDAVFILLFIKDVYCVMLQRFNYLRIQERLSILAEKRAKRIQTRIFEIEKNIERTYSKQDLEKDLAFIKKVRRSIALCETLVLAEDDYASLVRLNQIAKK